MQSWKTGEGYEDVAGFCKSASQEEIEKNGFVLTPGRYVGAPDSEVSDVNFSELLTNHVLELQRLKSSSESLDRDISQNLSRLIKGM